MAKAKPFSVKLSSEEDKRLTEISNFTQMTKAAVLKQSLNPMPAFESKIIYEALKKIDNHLNNGDLEAIRKEMMDLCMSLNTLTRKKENDTMTSETCKTC